MSTHFKGRGKGRSRPMIDLKKERNLFETRATGYQTDGAPN
jgi:hypothetical protein